MTEPIKGGCLTLKNERREIFFRGFSKTHHLKVTKRQPLIHENTFVSN